MRIKLPFSSLPSKRAIALTLILAAGCAIGIYFLIEAYKRANQPANNFNVVKPIALLIAKGWIEQIELKYASLEDVDANGKPQKLNSKQWLRDQLVIAANALQDSFAYTERNVIDTKGLLQTPQFNMLRHNCLQRVQQARSYHGNAPVDDQLKMVRENFNIGVKVVIDALFVATFSTRPAKAQPNDNWSKVKEYWKDHLAGRFLQNVVFAKSLNFRKEWLSAAFHFMQEQRGDYEEYVKKIHQEDDPNLAIFLDNYNELLQWLQSRVPDTTAVSSPDLIEADEHTDEL